VTLASRTPRSAAGRGNRDRYDAIAWLYDILDWPFEARYRQGRALIGARSSGLTLELGAGTGKNFSFYGASARVIAVDVAWPMLARARRRWRAPVRALLLADASHLPLRSRSVDTVVATFVCCVQADPRAALDEIARVLRPGGHALFMEFVLPPRGWERGLMLRLEPLLRALFGVHWGQHLPALLGAAGLHAIDVRPVWRDIVEAIVARRL
jgi:ubiquinone/menaquinone biosynthesis C-methylase UbiE